MQQTTFKTIQEAEGKQIEIVCTMRNGASKSMFFDAPGVISQDTICWKGYFVSTFILAKKVPYAVESYHLAPSY